MAYYILIYGFPFYLIAFEALLRNLFQLDVIGFVGPTIASAGLSFLLPLTKQNIGLLRYHRI